MKDYGDSRSWYKFYYSPPHSILGYLVYNICLSPEYGKVLMQYGKSKKTISFDSNNLWYEILNFDYCAEVDTYKESLLSDKTGGSINGNQCGSISDSLLWACLHPRKWWL